jgi:hypothetical protein
MRTGIEKYKIKKNNVIHYLLREKKEGRETKNQRQQSNYCKLPHVTPHGREYGGTCKEMTKCPF